MLRWRIQDHEGDSGCGMSLQHCLDNETLFGCPLLKNRKVYSCPQGQPTHSLPGMTLLCGWVIGVAAGQCDQDEGRCVNRRGPHAESPECWTLGLTLYLVFPHGDMKSFLPWIPSKEQTKRQPGMQQDNCAQQEDSHS